MPTINIRRRHNQSLLEAKHAVQRTAKALDQEFSIKSLWVDNHRLEFSRTGITGFIALYDHEIHVNAELGILVGMFKTTIEHEILRQLDEQFPSL